MNVYSIYKLREDKLKLLGFNNYKEYLKSKEWIKIKEKIKKRSAPKWNFCNICGDDKNLDLHHSSYKVIGKEHPGNTVKLLCRTCHNELHNFSLKNPNWSFYKICGKMRSYRKKNKRPYFKYTPTY